MSEPEHRIFTWRPEILNRREAASARVVLRSMDVELEQLAQAGIASPTLEAMRAPVAAALTEWQARPWLVRLRGRRHLSPGRVELRRWLEHGSAFALQQYNAQEPRP